MPISGERDEAQVFCLFRLLRRQVHSSPVFYPEFLPTMLLMLFRLLSSHLPTTLPTYFLLLLPSFPSSIPPSTPFILQPSSAFLSSLFHLHPSSLSPDVLLLSPPLSTQPFSPPSYLLLLTISLFTISLPLPNSSSPLLPLT